MTNSINFNDCRNSGIPVILLDSGKFITGKKRCDELQKELLLNHGRCSFISDTEIHKEGSKYIAFNYGFDVDLFKPINRQKYIRLIHGTKVRKIVPPPLPK